MRVEFINPPDWLLVDGWLPGVVISEQATPVPQIVLQMRVRGKPEEGNPAKVIFDIHTLSAIVRAIKESTVQEIRDILGQ